MKVRVLLLIGMVLLCLAAPVYGFDSIATDPVHQDMTREAFSFLKPDVVESIIDGNDFSFDSSHGLFSDVHFDDCNFTGGVDYINGKYKEVLAKIKANPASGMETFGNLLHTAQDFYAHSNWVNLGYDSLFESTNTLWFNGGGAPVLSPQNGYMLIQGEDGDIPKNLHLIRDFNSMVVTVEDTKTKTSYAGVVTGYFSNMLADDCPDSIAISHYDITPSVPKEADPKLYPALVGLNKDSEKRQGYTAAYNLALKQTKHEWCRLVTLVKSEFGPDIAGTFVLDWVNRENITESLADCPGLAIDAVGSSSGELGSVETGTLDTTSDKKTLDLCFVIDTTSSMEDDIDEGKANALNIINQVAASGLDYRICVVTFRDFPDGRHGEKTDYQSRVEVPFTNDTNQIVAAINGITVAGGKDWQESVYSGLMTAMDQSWRNGAQKVTILIGDAAPQDPEPGTGFTQETVLARAFAMDPVNIYPIMISNESQTYRTFAALADGSSGRIFNARVATDLVPTLLTAIETATGDTHLHIGGYARVFTTMGDTLNLRKGTSRKTEILERMPLGTIVQIIGGPEFVYPYIWWKVRAPDGQEGYSVEAADGVVTLVNIAEEEYADLGLTK